MSPRPAASPAMSTSTGKKALPAAKASNTNKLGKSSKPKRPLSAYNLFFQHERDRLLRGIASPFGYSHDLNHCTLGRKPSVRADRSKKVRPPPHGKIGFAQLAKTVGANWKSLDEKGKKYFEDRAAKEKARYRREIEIWKRKRVEGFVASSSSPSPSLSSRPVGTPSSSSASSSPLLTNSPAVIAPPARSIMEDCRLPPLPPKGAGCGQHQQQYAQYYNNDNRGGAPALAPLGYAPQRPPQEHGWFDWNAAPQPSSMISGPNHSYHQARQHQQEEEQLARNSFGRSTYHHGESYDKETMPAPYSDATAHHHQQQQQCHQDARGKCHGDEDFFKPLPQIAEPDPIPELPPSEAGRRIISRAQQQASSFAIDNPSDVLDFLAKFVCDT